MAKTADGVEVVAGMILYVPGPWVGHAEKVREVDADGRVYSGYAGSVFPGGVMDMSVCYSTHEAAAAAKKKEGE